MLLPGEDNTNPPGNFTSLPSAPAYFSAQVLWLLERAQLMLATMHQRMACGELTMSSFMAPPPCAFRLSHAEELAA